MGFAERRRVMGEELREKVKERYAGVARAVRDANGSESASCCGSSCCGPDAEALEVDMTGGSYSETEKRELPQLAAMLLGVAETRWRSRRSRRERSCWTSAAVAG